tara:strand:+ start:309 stop:800 length:492 start_codon:yes stop_codon:yes gene_type:complete
MNKSKNDIERLDELLLPKGQKIDEEIKKRREELDKRKVNSVKKKRLLYEFIRKESIEERLITISNHFIEKTNNKWEINTKGIQTEYKSDWTGYIFILKKRALFFPKYIKIRIDWDSRFNIDSKGIVKRWHVVTWEINDGKVSRDGEGTDELFETLSFVMAEVR